MRKAGIAERNPGVLLGFQKHFCVVLIRLMVLNYFARRFTKQDIILELITKYCDFFVFLQVTICVHYLGG